jgi:hypothetical protein
MSEKNCLTKIEELLDEEQELLEEERPRRDARDAWAKSNTSLFTARCSLYASAY